MQFNKLIVTLAAFVLVKGCPTDISDNKEASIITQQQTLDSNGIFHLEWEANLNAKRITFTITAETRGFVGFGISPNGGMDGADMVIGGVYPNGSAYITDTVGVGNGLPKIDDIQNWEFLEANENGTHTILKVSRPFDTCDPQDLKIEAGTNILIWSLGKTDEIHYHGTARGTSLAQLLDPPAPHVEEDDVKVWRMETQLEMPANETTYWCTVQKAPRLDKTHHIIGFEAYLPSPEALAHSHHFIVRECTHPEGKDLGPLLDPLVTSPGRTCYRESNTLITEDATKYCKAYVFVWAVGGKRTIFPKNVGFPLPDDRTSDYYLLEIHLSNPALLPGLKIDTGINIFYTPTLREHDASSLIVGYEVSAAQTIPPKTMEFITVGHCSSQCTGATLPKSGITVFNILLHSHNAGRRVKLRHFRNGIELPWLSYDDHYHFDYQQNRQLPKEIQLLPGDQFSLECTYDTSKRSEATIGGYSSEEEMCQSVLMYYPRIDLHMCSSTFPRNEIFQYFGIGEISSAPTVRDPIVSLPKYFRGKHYSEVLNELQWSDRQVNDLQNEVRFSNHRGVCSSRGNYKKNKKEQKWHIPNVTYTKVAREYSPPQTSCARRFYLLKSF